MLCTVSIFSLPPEEQRGFAKNPMCAAFPRIASCTYYRFGSAGKESNINALCILSLNNINDKVFLVLWWWFLILIFMGVGTVLFRMIQLNSAKLRFSLLDLRMHRYTVSHTACNGDIIVLMQKNQATVP